MNSSYGVSSQFYSNLLYKWHVSQYIFYMREIHVLNSRNSEFQ